jgi:hypothetical protein
MVQQGLGAVPAGFSGGWKEYVCGKMFAPEQPSQQQRQMVLSKL